MLKLINKLLSILPFNGKKTHLSLISLFLAYYLPEIDPATVEVLGSKSVEAWQSLSELFVVISVLHAQIKKKVE